LSYTLQ